MEKQTPANAATGEKPETKLQFFASEQLPPEQLLQLKGGDGDAPPTDGIGHEDQVNN